MRQRNVAATEFVNLGRSSSVVNENSALTTMKRQTWNSSNIAHELGVSQIRLKHLLTIVRCYMNHEVAVAICFICSCGMGHTPHIRSDKGETHCTRLRSVPGPDQGSYEAKVKGSYLLTRWKSPSEYPAVLNLWFPEG